MMGFGSNMMYGDGFWTVGLTVLIWNIVGILVIVWLLQQITKK